MDKEQIYDALKALNEKLKQHETRGEIYLYGGAVMCLCLDARDSTGDIDSLFEPKNLIYKLADEIKEEKGLPYGWLNDAVKGFVSTQNEMELFESMSNLDIYNTKPKYLFAMKCISCRIDPDEHDMDDIDFLIDYLDIKTVEEAENIICEYFSENMILPKVHFMLVEKIENLNKNKTNC